VRISLIASLIALGTTVACSKPQSGAGQPLRVATAASLQPAMEELGAAYTQRTGRAVVIAPGASGNLVEQIRQGAPYDLFASADESWVDEAISDKVAVADSKTLFAYGRVVAWSAREPLTSLAELTEPRFQKIAIAKPEAAPYGRAAKEALVSAGLWQQIESRVVYGANVHQALQFAETENADVVLTALSLVLDKPGRYLLVDEAAHGPLAQVAVACAGGDQPAAKDFIAFLDSAEGHAILEKYGLVQRGQNLAATGE
jgi:molybdate transport system substrate-binding protein